MKVLIIFCLLINFAFPKQLPVILEKGSIAPFDGVLMTEDLFIEASNSRRELRLEREIKVEMERQLSMLEDKLKKELATNSFLKENLEKESEKKWNYFLTGSLTGALLTSLIILYSKK